MITYTETVFNMEARKVEPVARWAVEITAADLLTVTRNGEQKTVKIVPDSGFVYSLKKTYIRAADGAEGLYKALERWAAEDFPAALLLKVLRWAFFDCKPAKITTN
jgi:hypothetical protein